MVPSLFPTPHSTVGHTISFIFSGQLPYDLCAFQLFPIVIDPSTVCLSSMNVPSLS